MKRRGEGGPSAIDVIEETANVLRAAPAPALLAYYLGAIPFIILFLHHAARLASGIGGRRAAVTGALLLAAAFVWMKCWQVVFASRIMATLRRHDPPRWTTARVWRMFVQQTAVQPAGMILIPLAAVFAIPFAWVHAFFQNITVLGDGVESGVTALAGKSWKHAQNWPRQNHVGIWLFSPWMLGIGIGMFVLMNWLLSMAVPSALVAVVSLIAFSTALVAIGLSSPLGFLVAGNVAALIFFLPWAAQHWFGLRTVFALSGVHAIFNSTFLLIVFSVTFLVLDPLMKTFYVLRCFYGESRQSGEDLRVDLRTLAARATAAAALFLLLVVVLAPHTSHAKRTSDSAATPAPAPAVDSPGTEGSAKEISNEWKVEKAEVPTIGIPPDELDRKIGDVLKRPIYQWRMPQPRDAELDEEKGFFASFIDEVNSLIERAGRWFANRLEDFEEWLRNFFKRGGRDDSASSSGGPGPDVWVYILVFSLIALVVIAGFLIFKNWRAKKDAVLAAQAAGAPAAPDIHDENVLASQLPADEWLALARELVAKGEFRAALRALFLASLAMLAQQQLVAIARGKTNHDYLRELRRRSHALPAVPEIFRATVFDFDRVWYGRDAADAGLVTKSEERFGALRESVAGGGDAGAQAPVQKPEPHHA